MACLVLIEAELLLTLAVARPVPPPLRVRPDLVYSTHVSLLTPVTVQFDRNLDSSHLQVEVRPATTFVVVRGRDRLAVSPTSEWAPDQRYRITLRPAGGFDRRLMPAPWAGEFQTQPRLSVSGFKVAGHAAGQQALVQSEEVVEIDFPEAMRPDSVHVVLGDRSVAPGASGWSTDGVALSLALTGLTPYQPLNLTVPRGALTASGQLLTEGGDLHLLPVAVLPSNPASGIRPDSGRASPVEVVIDNAPGARPQSGLQQADLVYEYLSEYQVTRMTAIYLGQMPGEIGPVRSCRMVNPYLNFALQGLTMCSGGSVGTLHYMFGNPEGGVPVPGIINDFDHGRHFDRVGFRPAPHNVYTSSDQAYRLRAEQPLPPGSFAIRPPQPDSSAGDPAEPPAVPLHSVSYGYEAGSDLYARFDHGRPFIDAGTGGQVGVKNVVLLHVPFRDAGWIEDEAGGAGSIWYDLLGSGPAEIYSGGRLISATWHMGLAPGQLYYENHTPVWFSDASGRALQLNSGLTWVHVLGNGQAG